MNVLLAEANVPYPQLYDMEDINPSSRAPTSRSSSAPTTSRTRRARRPRARFTACRSSTSTPPNVVVLKRSMSPGFAGIDNDLFYRANTAMLFGDAKASVEKLVAAVKAA